MHTTTFGKFSAKAPPEKVKPDTTPAEQPLVHAPDGVVQTTTPLEFRAIYERWFDDVSLWIRALGTPETDREDLAQDVFVIVHRRLPFFDGKNIGGWLFQIARNRVRDFRRLRWVRHILFGSVPLSERLCVSGASPSDALETKEKQALLERLLGKLNDAERATLVLFEIDGYSGEAIAELQAVPLNTVWARIYMARKKLKALLAKEENSE